MSRTRRLGLAAVLCCVIAVLVGGVLPSHAQADDHLLIRGNYYREASTRVLQPMVDVSVDAPDERFTVGAGYLLDAITSASIGQGTAVVSGDQIDPPPFTELRHEATLRLGSRIGNWSFGGYFRYSSETDYIARNVGVNLSIDILDRAGTISAAYSYGFDRVFQIVGAFGERNPWCGGLRVPQCPDDIVDDAPNKLQTHYASLGYTHAILPTLLGYVALEGSDARGPLDNPYRDGYILNGLEEAHPLLRRRVAASAGVRWALPKARMVVDPRYRFYADDWDIRAHAADLRLHFRVLRHTRLRVRYRFYVQSAAEFYVEDQSVLTGASDELRTGDVKMEPWSSHTPGLQVTYELDGLAKYRGFGWLRGAWIQATYNQVIYVFDTPNNRYCQDNADTVCLARLGSLAFGMSW